MSAYRLPQKLRSRAVWISDVHLGFKDCKADYLLDFLSRIETETLYLLGDMIDMWALKKRFFWPTSHHEVLRAINNLALNGTRVVYIPGNHDEPCRDYVGQFWGAVEIKYEDIHETAQGKKLLMFHGDVLDNFIRLGWFNRAVGDAAYEFLLFVNRWVNYLRKRMGFSYWSLASYIKNRVKNARDAIEIYEDAAIREAERRGLDGVICGHIHQAEIIVKDGILYCNDGDWIESCTALMEDQEGKIELIHWTERCHAIKSLDACNDDAEKAGRLAM